MSKFVYVIWDEHQGYIMNRVYADEPSAKIALQEHFLDFSITGKRAQIEKIPVVSYRNI